MRRLVMKFGMRRRQWRHDEKGATAVEFALIAMIFFWLFMGIVEIGMLMIMNNGLEDGVARAARMIRTGEVQKNGISVAQFRKRICDQVVLKSSCTKALRLDVQTFRDFASIKNLQNPSFKNGELQISENFQPGGPRQVVLVRAFYNWRFFTPLIAKLMSNTDVNTFLLQAATTFRNEPFSSK